MTKACKCDRCGELFPIREDSTLYRIERYESDREYEEVDLCDVCMRAFEYWMEAATKSEVYSLKESEEEVNNGQPDSSSDRSDS